MIPGVVLIDKGKRSNTADDPAASVNSLQDMEIQQPDRLIGVVAFPG